MSTPIEETNVYRPSGDIQVILSKSYSLFFFAFIIGLVLDLVIKVRIGVSELYPVGLFMIFIASLWIHWAQSVNKKPVLKQDGTRDFTVGPYKYSRHPTYFGIFILMVGAGLVTDSASILITSITAFVLSVFTFMEKEERRHVKKYGQIYLDYMKKVRRVI